MSMTYLNDFLLNISALYRYTQKYFDRNLAPYSIGSGQLFFLLLIYENEGISMQQLALMADIDKGTTTKSIRRLDEEGYVEVRTDENDKRVKRLYTTEKCGTIINDLYSMRNEFVNQLMKGLDEDAKATVTARTKLIVRNAREIVPEEDSSEPVRFGGIQKLTLLDYPGQVACTIFTAGCNMRCPFCHNKDLVFIPENMDYIETDDILAFLKKRGGIIDAVCISGGEPLLQSGLPEFMRQVRELGYKIKLDTNGSFPERLEMLIREGLADRVAMDVKNSPSLYAETAGIAGLDLTPFAKSRDLLLSGMVEAEFRTTVVKGLHTEESLIEAAKWIAGAPEYYLQQFKDSGDILAPGSFSAFDREEMLALAEAVRPYVPSVQVRGV